MPQPGCVTKIVRCSTDQSALPPWGLAFETQPKALSLNETAAFAPDTSLTVAPAAPPLVSAPLIDGSGFSSDGSAVTALHWLRAPRSREGARNQKGESMPLSLTACRTQHNQSDRVRDFRAFTRQVNALRSLCID